ncbi:MAG: hypothetical protein COV48_10720 [Elusimicrobia bacterium CG11_big_fil_rev_8_21_14_0_20_64_6]|nr:MAG: hypothetical protein COV48_10720 [Elusimicrobia bacterium CG11_big_fil_rev_8_21_14_0_20_64_6]
MRQELNGVKAEVSALGVQVNALQTDVSTLGEQMSAFTTETRLRLGRLETITHNTAIAVTGLAEDSVQIKKQLTKLDELDGIKKCLEVFTSEILASRSERTLAGKSFLDQQATLTDHELRLTRIELRGKQS